MKTIVLSLCLIVWVACVALSQNLVPNPSFEDYSSCPTTDCQIHRAIGWSSYGNTPNYFNACNSGSWSVPQSALGYQSAATGSAYASFFCYGPTVAPDDREYIGRQLISPLIIGQLYYVSIKVALTESAGCAIDKLGVLFSTKSYALDTTCALTTLLPLRNFSHIYSNSIITDTANWTNISGSFTADSAYLYIVIGNFFADSNTSFIQTIPTTICQAHYILDDVYVGTEPVTIIAEPISFPENAIVIFPNPANSNLTINVETGLSFSYSLYDIVGNTIIPKTEKQDNTNTIIDISSFSTGIYFINIEINNTVITKKLIINP